MHRNQNQIPFGLRTDEVEFRKIKGLTNDRKDINKINYFQIVIENAFTIFNIINLFIISGLFYYYFKFNDNRLLLDSIGILIVILINTTLSIYQKIKAIRALEKVELLREHKAKVIREGLVYTINLDEIVIDDVIYLTRGDQIPVDCVILSSQKFEVDESLITGESLAISKKNGDNLLSGSFCVNGYAYAVVTRVGAESYSNQITRLAKKFKLSTSPLMNKINTVFIISFIVALILITIEGVRDISIGEIAIEDVRKISTIAFTIIPEGLIFFSAITFSIGIYRISRIGAIVQQINAIDTFPSIDVICLDKTGTITKNEIAISDFIPANQNYSIEQLKSLLGSFYSHSSNKNQTLETLRNFPISDQLIYVDEIPFNSELKYSAIIFNNISSGMTEIYVLGALDVMMEKNIIIHKGELDKVLQKYDLFGKRNLLFCKRIQNDVSELKKIDINELEFEPLAIVSLKDTLREDFVDITKQLSSMGKEFKVLTGDSVDATYTILRDVGLEVSLEDIIDFRLLNEKNIKQIDELVLKYKFFARLTPSQKLKIVKILKSHNKKVCFIGDGINDLPAIKEADLGISMEEGMTITKEVSDIVLLQNKFSLLPEIFKEGNKIINTIRYITSLYLVKNFSVLLMLFMNWFANTPFFLTPRKSSLLSALAVGLPSYFISFKNSNINKTTNFFNSLINYVFFTSIIIMFFSYSSYYVSSSIFGYSIVQSANIMYSVFTLGTITSFFTLVAFEDKSNYRNYALYATLMALLFMFFSIVRINIPPFNLISEFYEFEFWDWNDFILSFFFSVALSIVLIYFHKYKNDQLNKSTNKEINK